MTIWCQASISCFSAQALVYTWRKGWLAWPCGYKRDWDRLCLSFLQCLDVWVFMDCFVPRLCLAHEPNSEHSPMPITLHYKTVTRAAACGAQRRKGSPGLLDLFITRVLEHCGFLRNSQRTLVWPGFCCTADKQTKSREGQLWISLHLLELIS